MSAEELEWRPGSFTKNFSWGRPADGLRQLHEVIRLGFDGQMEDVSREVFRARVEKAQRPDYIPINFFLFNRPVGGVDHLIADELVFQAIKFDHSVAFDKLALMAFNLSYVGTWHRAKPYQRRPALWAHYYVRDRVARQLKWRVGAVNAGDIERFVFGDHRYRAQSARKLATNLNYLYRVGRLSEFPDTRVTRWWVDALFLALDRLIEDRLLSGLETPEGRYGAALAGTDFVEISGLQSLEKDLAIRHLLALYTACGGRGRFFDDSVRELTALRLPDVQWLLANDDTPKGAVHPTNANILKSIPRSCAFLAKYAGFEVIEPDELATFDPAEFVRRRTRSALRKLREDGVNPTMTAEELTRITREK